MLKLLGLQSDEEHADLSSGLSGSPRAAPNSKYPTLDQNQIDRAVPINEMPFTSTTVGSSWYLRPDSRHEADVICKACKQILITCCKLAPEHRFRTLRMNYGLPAVRESASLGCHMCSIFYLSALNKIRNGRPSAYSSIADSDDTGYMSITMYSHEAEKRVFWMQAICGTSADPAGGSHNLSVFPIDMVGTNFRKVLEGRPSPSLGCYTGDLETLELAKAWLQNCLQNHSLCKETNKIGGKVDPARLLFVDVPGQNSTIQVVDTEAEEKTEYATLSHCWGDQSRITKLTSENERKLREGTDLSSLPKTFRHAVDITRSLGYRYLWIDSLCILQDSTTDWLEHSTRMAQIYAQSAFTIAAIKSSDSRGGCFTTQRIPLGLRPLLVHDLQIRVEPVSREPWLLEVDETGRRALPLHQRAWVIQERLSSPRTIYWGNLGIYWECRCIHGAEGHLSDVLKDEANNTKMLMINLEQILLNRTFQSGEDVNTWEESFLIRWNAFLQLYTQCRLTYWTDRVAAMAGLVWEIEQRANMRCVFGLWDFSWASSLVWWAHTAHVDHRVDAFYENSKSSGRLENGMPSWSWTSIHADISYSTFGGPIEWQAKVESEEDLVHKPPHALRIHSSRRKVAIGEYDGVVLAHDGQSRLNERGDYHEDFPLFPDIKISSEKQEPLWILLILRRCSRQTPKLYLSQCLLIRSIGRIEFERVGLVGVRHGDNDDPFDLEDPLAQEVIVLV